MTNKIPMPDLADIKNFPRNNPKAIILKISNKLRVVERQYYWDKDKGRGLEKRIYLGYVVDNEFLTNEEYQQRYNKRGKAKIALLATPSQATFDATVSCFNESLSTVLVGELPLYYEVAQDIGLIEDLSSVFGEELAKVMLCLSFHKLSTGQNLSYLYSSWAEGRLLPFKSSLMDKEIGEYLELVSDKEGWQKRFFKARIKRLRDEELLAFHIKQIASAPQIIPDTEYGIGKEGSYQRQQELVLLVGKETYMPAFFSVLPDKSDISTVQDQLYCIDKLNDHKQVFATVLDSSEFSDKKLATSIDRGCRVIMASNANVSWIKDAIASNLLELTRNKNRILGTPLWGTTIPIEHQFEDRKIRKLWLHVYHSDMRSHYENGDFYEDLEKFEDEWLNWEGEDPALCPLHHSPLRKFFKKDIGVPGVSALEQDHEAIDATTCFFGIFINVTTMECTAKEALFANKVWDLVTRCFKPRNPAFFTEALNVHKEKAMEGSFMISFIAMSILSSIYLRMGQKSKFKPEYKEEELSLSTELSFDEIKNLLATISIIQDSKGNRRYMAISKKQHEIARRLGFPNLYTKLPDWGNI